MLDAEQFILSHMTDPVPYDPVKAHEYYLRKRQLKGRHPAKAVVPASKHAPAAKLIPKQRPKPAQPHKSAEQRRKEIEASVARLNHKLELLRNVLRQLTKEAKARSGIKTPEKKTPAKAAAKKLTPHEKAVAAKRAKELYEKNKNKPLSQQEKELQDKITAITTKIKKMRAEIAAAKQQTQSRTSSSVGARANHNK